VAVLGTKLHLPATRRPLVARPRLTELVGSGASELPRLVLVSAPAGFGKTTLLSQWLAPTRPGGQAPRVAWLSLDEGDNDLRRLLTHLVGALDDYHVIDNPAVHEATSFLLEHLPRHVGLAIATRADPPLPLARLRGRGGLVEVRAADLRFTPGESETFFNELMGLDLSPDDILALDARTEGWPAGLQLAGTPSTACWHSRTASRCSASATRCGARPAGRSRRNQPRSVTGTRRRRVEKRPHSREHRDAVRLRAAGRRPPGPSLALPVR
jgi:LuxR family transcriptional regulator, maltose regulon positive regulatory protein